MSINTTINTPENTLNYMKYVEIQGDTRYPAVTGGQGQGVFNKAAVLVQNIDSFNGVGEDIGNYNLGTDSFGRLRVSAPLTLFDSTHRYSDNDLWNQTVSVGASSTFIPYKGLINLEVGPLSGSKIYRETKRVFSYQPGKSLQNLNTFNFSPSATNLRQRIGYFGDDNGIYLELLNDTLFLVQRTIVTGSITETRVPQSEWNHDTMDGTGQSGISLDLTKAQIQFIDLEWLGAGTVRTGFVINGIFQACHYFHHANINQGTYLTTGSLPVRYEIENLGDTGSNHILNQICTTVLSEGGYELRGRQQVAGTEINTPRTLSTPAGAFYPVVSIRLKSTRLDAIVIMTALSILGDASGTAFYNWKVTTSGITSGGSWETSDADSSVEYNTTGTSTSFTEARTLASGFFSSTNQAAVPVDILKEALFKFQLERDSFTGLTQELSLVVATDTVGAKVFGSMDWEEVSR